MKQLFATIGNQTINGIISALIAALYLVASKTLRGLAWFSAVSFVSFAIVCFFFGAQEFFNRLPTSIETIKTFF